MLRNTVIATNFAGGCSRRRAGPAWHRRITQTPLYKRDRRCNDVRVLELTRAELDQRAGELYDAAAEISARAYAPYSGFPVGAAVRTGRGALFRGCNVENASYGLTCCAERSAVFAAVAAEGRGMRVREVAVYVNAASASPCGACRQVIAEFGREARVLFSDRDRIVDATIAELLPSHFIPPEALRGG